MNTGVSIRGGLQWVQAAKGLALVRNRDYVTPQDIIDTGCSVLAHRLSLVESTSQQPDLEQKRKIIEQLIQQTQPPK